MQIVIEAPDLTDGKWLTSQLRALQAIRYPGSEDSMLKGAASDFYFYSYGEGHWLAAVKLLGRYAPRVIFHRDGTAAIDSAGSYGSIRDGNVPEYSKRWPKTDWMGGLLALAKGIASRLQMPTTEQAEKVATAVRQFVEAVGDAHIEDPVIKVTTKE